MTIKSFYYYYTDGKFYSYIDKAFEEIKNNNIQSLILDLRSNTGGDLHCTSHLFSYLELKPVPFLAKTAFGYEDLARPIPLAAKNSFHGKLFVLINGGCFSATSYICSLLKFHNRGLFIGEPTGGTFECNGDSEKYNTRETRMTLLVPQKTTAAAVKGISREYGIIPDYFVEPDIADLMKGKDTVKEFAFRLVEKSE